MTTDTSPRKDDIAIQHRPENAQSEKSDLKPTDADGESRVIRDERLGKGTSAPELPEDPRIARFETLADWLDTRFRLPIIGTPVGLDGIIGLIPGVGDTITTGLSGWLIYEAHQAGAPKHVLAKMGWNVGVDFCLGLIPVFGDLIDFAHKANAKNARLLVEHLRSQHALHQHDTPLEEKLRKAA